MNIPLATLEEITGNSGIAPRAEAMLPIGVRRRQLRVRTLLAGMLLSQADHRPAHLTRVRDALIALPAAGQARLGVTEDWKAGPHQLTYRQTERTFGLVTGALAKDVPDGTPSEILARICDDLLEASIPSQYKQASRALAVDWSDVETFSRPPPHGTSDCADPEASWGHRNGGGPGQDSELFFGYYLSAATMMREEHGPAVPELTRRMTVCSCQADPARALVPVLTAMPGDGIPLGDILADSGYAHRDAEGWAIPLRQAGAQLIQDLHPSDRGPRGTHEGAIIANGNLYCPVTPRLLLELGPLARDATPEETAAHDTRSAELARYKLGKITADDTDGYHRVICPAVMGKIRCPLRPAFDEAGPAATGDPHPAGAPAGLLRPADPHHSPGRGRQDPPEARLPLRGAPALVCPAHRRRADLLHRQGPGQQQHRPRLDPADGPGPAHALAGLPDGRPKPADPDRLGRPPGRQRPPRRGRPAAPHPAAAAARPSPTWLPQAPRHDTAGEPRTVTRSPQLRHARPAGPAPNSPPGTPQSRKPPTAATCTESQTQT